MASVKSSVLRGRYIGIILWTQDRTRQLMELGLADVDRGRAISPLLAAYMSLMVAPLRRLYSWAVPEARQ